jgi:hypothetical protein
MFAIDAAESLRFASDGGFCAAFVPVAMMRFWRRKKHDENFGVAAGQRFRSVTAAPIIWEVETVARQPWEATPHVRLHRVGAPADAKTISVQVLLDGRFYLPAN